MNGKLFLLFVLIFTLSACTTSPGVVENFKPIPGSAENGAVSYEKDVFPILMGSCWKCHGGEKISREFDMTTYASLMKGSKNGPQVISGDSANSGIIISMMNGKMPKQGRKMFPEEIELIQRWIDEGAKNN